MAKPNLLEYVQLILSAMDADEVNSISDTQESYQIAQLIRTIYRQVVEEYQLQATEQAFRLDSAADNTKPTHMTLPSHIHEVVSIRYDTKTANTDPSNYVEIPYATPDEFLDRVSNNDSSASNYQSVTDPTTNLVLIIRNDHAPQMWTTLDGGKNIIFDSFDSDVDDCLQNSKTQGFGRARNDINLVDTAELDLPEALASLVLNEATEMAFEIYMDGAPRVVNERARFSRMKAKDRQERIRKPRILNLPDYGR